MNKNKKIFLSLFVFLLICSCACAMAKNNGSLQGFSSLESSDNTMKDKKILIAYFSRADENYSVGYVEKGNTQIIAEYIASKFACDTFHIQRKIAYPKVYKECTAECQEEKCSRPELLEDKDISGYDIIFLGYPTWWGDMPMPVYTFLENKKWQGKIIIPFNTSEGSGLSGTVNTIKSICNGAEIKEGLTIRGSTAQNNRSAMAVQVDSWLEKITK